MFPSPQPTNFFLSILCKAKDAGGRFTPLWQFERENSGAFRADASNTCLPPGVLMFFFTGYLVRKQHGLVIPLMVQKFG